ncbi:P-loop containing nucleoside triphosphate hydrolase protein [Melanogaster broomeanus]|nr:P-loop containing nucleoside triphosphate hydrolase protein [Melanogaster broomeanus]
MNVVIVGEHGIGKSSIINLIAGRNVAKASNDSGACTLEVESYTVSIDGQDFTLWDTPGLEEGSATLVNTRFSDTMLKSLQQFDGLGGIDLLVYCMHGSRAKTALLNNYKAIRSLVPSTTPIVAVITRLERYQGCMENWWSNNAAELSNFGMKFADHACITALPNSSTLSPAFRERLAHSQSAVRNLIRRSCTPNIDQPSLVTFPSLGSSEYRNIALRGLNVSTTLSDIFFT